MKKFVFLIAIAFVCLGVSYGQSTLVDDQPLTERVDELVRGEGWNDLSTYFNETTLSFKDGDWFYLISYEPEKGNLRKAYLYKKKMVGYGEWKPADPQPLFEHASGRTINCSYDKLRMNSKYQGTSYLQKINVEGKDLIVVFTGIKLRYNRTKRVFTHLFVFNPIGVHEDGSVEYNHIHYDLTESTIFSIKRVRDNVFYNNDGMMVRVSLDEKERPLIQLVDHNGNRAGHFQYH